MSMSDLISFCSVVLIVGDVYPTFTPFCIVLHLFSRLMIVEKGPVEIFTILLVALENNLGDRCAPLNNVHKNSQPNDQFELTMSCVTVMI